MKHIRDGTCLALFLGLIIATPICAELVRIDPKEGEGWDATPNYRGELEALQDTTGVCQIQLITTHERVITGARAVRLLTEDQLAVIHKMHRELLYDGEFREHVAALVEQDAADVHNGNVVPTEFGGVGMNVYGSIELLIIPSTGRLRLRARGDGTASGMEQSNWKHHLPEWVGEIIPHVFRWHVHAGLEPGKEDTCSPSGWYDTTLGWQGDIGYALHVMRRSVRAGDGRAHNFLFAKQNNRMFSTVYFGGVADASGAWFVAIVALPTHSY